jgi:deoxyribodipyrimidine photo-lyase
VVYWLQRAQRALDNPALEVAIACGNALGLPVVAYFSVIPNYPNANLRHYHFLQQGLHDLAEGMAERGVGFVVRRPTDGDTLEAFSMRLGRRWWWAMRMSAASRSDGGRHWRRS